MSSRTKLVAKVVAVLALLSALLVAGTITVGAEAENIPPCCLSPLT
jgi:hypothetical protein